MGDPYWANVVFLSGFEGGTIVDESPLAQTVTLSGSTAQSATWAAYGTKSLARPGYSSGWASVPNNAAMALGSGPFTIEGIFRWTDFGSTWAVRSTLVQHGNANGVSPLSFLFSMRYISPTDHRLELEIDIDNDGYVDYAITSSTFVLTINTDYHLVVDFDGTKYRFYKNGVNVGSTTAAYTLSTATAALFLGASVSAGAETPTNYNQFNGYMDEVRVSVGVARYATDTSFSPLAAAFPRGPDLDVTITEGVGMEGLTGEGAIFTTTLIEGVAVSQANYQAYPSSLVDSFRASPGLEAAYLVSADIADTLGIAQDYALVAGWLVADTITLSDALTQSGVYGGLLQDGVGSVDAVYVGFPTVLADAVGVALTQTAAEALTVVEALDLAPVIAPTAIYGLTATEVVQLGDALLRFIDGTVSDTITTAPVLTAVARFDGTLADTTGLADAPTPQMVLRVDAADDFDLDDVQLLNAIYAGTIADGVEISAAYFAPGSVTTWAVNTRTGATTEYQNFDFNSFAQISPFKYIGASANGLYELGGDTDDTADIIAQLKSGLAQFGGAHLTSFKAVYLAVRGGGTFVFRLVTGDGRTYDYSVIAQDMETTKIRLGKGLRARYFAFELISAGQDFDLEDVEFVPLVAQRRV